MLYRADIDGLRAIAIFLVLFYHLDFSLFKNGFIGVDIFFVISGYLITHSIIREIEVNKFSIISFYHKRFRKIFPSLSVVLLTTLLLGLFLLPPPSLKELNESALATLLFFSNFLFHNQSGYFDTVAQLKPLLHTWSLAVEEQFYLIVPLFVIFNRSIKLFYFLVIVIFFISMFLFFQNNNLSLKFFLPQYRIWQICVGSLCAFFEFYKYVFIKKLPKNFSYLGIILVIISLIFVNKIEWPNYRILLPIAGAVLIILNNDQNKILKIYFLTFIGKRSYSIYLVHYPIISFATYYIGFKLSSYQIILVIILIFISSLILYSKVERYFILPNQNIKNTIFHKFKVYYFVSIIFVFIIPISYMIFISNGFLLKSNRAALEKTVSTIEREHISCNKEIISDCITEFPNAKIIILGDSNAYHFAVGAQKFSPNNEVISLTKGSCLALSKLTVLAREGHEWNSSCQKFNKEVKNILNAEFTKDKIIIVSGAYIKYLYSNKLYLNERQSKLTNFPKITLGDENLKPLKDNEKFDWMREYLIQIASELSSKSKQVILLGPIPPQPFAVRSEPLLQFNGHNGIDQKLFFQYAENLLSIFSEIEKQKINNLKVIYPHKKLCDNLVPERCIGFFNGEHYYGDEFHISAIGQYIAYSELFEYLRDFKWN